MEFQIGAMPALEEFGGPPDDDPDSFIDLNRAGLAGLWLHDGDRLFVLFEDEYGPTADDELTVLLREMAARGDGCPSQDDVLNNPRASWGRIYAQERGPELVNVEYEVEWRRGRAVPPDQHPVHDEAVESAVRRWLTDPEAEVGRIVRERSGEMR